MSKSPPQHESSVIFFLDRTHQSKITARLLRMLGVLVELHKVHFVHDAPDPEWIPICAEKGWAIISGDRGIEADGVNRSAVIANKAKVFMLTSSELRGPEWAATLVAARQKIAQIAECNIGPFYCTVEPAGDGHVGKPRFEPGGYALKTEPVPDSAISVEQTPEQTMKAEVVPRSGELFS